MNLNGIDFLRRKALEKPARIVFPEAAEDKILKAAEIIKDEKLAVPVFVGNEADISAAAVSAGVDIGGIDIISCATKDIPKEFIGEMKRINPVFDDSAAGIILSDPLYFGSMMTRMGISDAMVAGLSHTTAEVVTAAGFVIGMQKGIKTASSIYLMNIPGYQGPEGNLLVFADGGVCPEPTEEELAEIAITTAGTAKALLGWEPRVAMLSFSTKGSASHPRTERVIKALAIAKERRPDLLIDGEFQPDAAIVPEVAARKVRGESPVAGRANVLIFPDLDAGNIAYKLVERLAKAEAYGPFLQGFAKTVSDLSRGSSVEDIVGVSIMASVRAQTPTE